MPRAHALDIIMKHFWPLSEISERASWQRAPRGVCCTALVPMHGTSRDRWPENAAWEGGNASAMVYLNCNHSRVARTGRPDVQREGG